MTEREFHRRRRMVAVVHGSVMVAESGSAASHEQWLREFGIDYLEHPRGYVLGERLVLYQGRDFDAPANPFEITRAVLELFPAVAEVGLGARPAAVGQVWEPRLLYRRSEIE